MFKSKDDLMEKINWDTVLQFNYYLAGVRGRLRLCHLGTNSSRENEELNEFADFMDNSFRCSFLISGVNMQIDSRKWKTAQVDLPKSVTQV